MIKKYLAAALLSAGIPTSFSASFDCVAVVHPVERMICASSELSRLDEEVGNAYKQALAGPAAAAEIKSAQQDWIRETRKCAEESCILNLYKERLKTLQQTFADERPKVQGTPTSAEPNIAQQGVNAAPAATQLQQAAQAPTNSDKVQKTKESGVGIYFVALIALGLIGFALKKLLGIGKQSQKTTAALDKTEENPSAAHTSTTPELSNRVGSNQSTPSAQNVVNESVAVREISMIGTKPNLKNIQSFEELMEKIECNNFLGWYFSKDPRHQKGVVDGLSDVWESCFSENRENKYKEVEKCLNDFLKQPDLYSLWKYSLLIKYANDATNASWSSELPNQWSLLESIGGSTENCLVAMKEVKRLFLSEQIGQSNHDDAMKSLVLCFLACSFADEETYSHLSRLMNLIGQNSYIDDFEFESGTEGVGELLFECRRVVEELTDIRVDAPEGVDLDRDGYLDYVDWDDVATRIYESLA